MDGIPPIEPFRMRKEELEKKLSDPAVFQDQRNAAKLGRENQHVTHVIELYEAYEKILKDAADNQSILNDSEADAEFKELAKEELKDFETNKQEAHHKLIVAMIPAEETDSRDTVVEIRAGTGGDEAALFAGALYRMYVRYAEIRGWTTETMGSNTSEAGGFKEISFIVRGEDVYKNLKHESGVHRVQRVPATEANGRIHTSAATVAVLPEAQEVDIQINPQDIDVSVCRASGPGGQGVNTTDSAVQILHKPTGLIVTCADERSQQKNRVKAMTVLRSRLLKAKEEEERAKYAADRKKQIGTGDRSERIRTYNFPQGRLTDHRINLTIYSLPQIMEGEIQELIDALLLEEQKLKLESLLPAS